VARDEHGSALRAEGTDQVAHLLDPGGIQPVGRLVQDQHRRVLEQRRAEAEALFHAQRIGPYEVVLAAREAHPVQDRVDRGPPDPVQPAQQLEVPAGREPRVQRRRLDDGSHLPEHGGELAWSLRAQQGRPSGARTHQPQQAADRGGLAGAVRP
jgi:hypothetical protein